MSGDGNPGKERLPPGSRAGPAVQPPNTAFCRGPPWSAPLEAIRLQAKTAAPLKSSALSAARCAQLFTSSSLASANYVTVRL